MRSPRRSIAIWSPFSTLSSSWHWPPKTPSAPRAIWRIPVISSTIWFPASVTKSAQVETTKGPRPLCCFVDEIDHRSESRHGLLADGFGGCGWGRFEQSNLFKIASGPRVQRRGQPLRDHLLLLQLGEGWMQPLELAEIFKDRFDDPVGNLIG